jgi:hypothetical protein
MVLVPVRILQYDTTRDRVGVRQVGSGSVFSSDLDHSPDESGLVSQNRDY